MFMPFNQQQYINKFNKETYKTIPIRIRRDNEVVMQKLNNTRNKNKYIINLIEKDVNPDVLTIKQIKQRILPVLSKHGIYEIYLFGSYARGEANNNSDVDIYCESGDVKSLFDISELQDELKLALGKDVDLVFIDSKMNAFFEQQLKGDLIKLC